MIKDLTIRKINNGLIVETGTYVNPLTFFFKDWTSVIKHIENTQLSVEREVARIRSEENKNAD